MARYYEMLAKARRTGDLFDDSGASLASDAAERQAGAAAFEAATPGEPHDAAPAPRVRWQRQLSEAAGRPELLQAARLGLCSFDEHSLSSIAVATAQWMARHSADPVLLVEADWSRSSGVAGLLQLDRRGLGNAINDSGARMDSLLQEGPAPNLTILGSGAVPKAQAPRLAEKINGVISSLRRRYPNVLLVMPPADGADWPGFDQADVVDAGLLAVRPRSANRRRIELGVRQLRSAGFPLAGVLLDDGARAPVSLRLGHLAQPASSAGAEL